MFRGQHTTTLLAALAFAGAATAGQHPADGDGLDESAASVRAAPPTVATAGLPSHATYRARVQVSPAAWSPPTSRVLADGWNSGFYSSIAVDRAGTTHVAYFDDGTGSVELVTCTGGCTQPSLRRLSRAAGIGTDIAVLQDELIVSFLDLDTRTVQLATCAAPGCADVQVRPIAPVDTAGSTRLGVTPGGDLVVAYPTLGGGVTVARCERLDCRAATVTTFAGSSAHFDLAVDGRGEVWLAIRTPTRQLALSRCRATTCEQVATSHGAAAFPSVDVTPDGTAVASFHSTAGDALHVLVCARRGSSCREIVADDTGDVGYFSVVMIRDDGRPIIFHRSERPGALRAVDCRRDDCSVVAHTTVDQRGDPGQHLSAVIGPDGHPRIAHHDGSSRTLRLAICSNGDCSAPPASEHGGLAISIRTSSDGIPKIAWRDPETLDLHLTDCTSGPCPSSDPVDSGGDVGLHPTLMLDDHGTRIVHQDARTGGIRLVSCTGPCPVEPPVDTFDAGTVDTLTAHANPDGTVTMIVGRDDGTIWRACTTEGCRESRWTPIGTGRPGGPVAAAPFGDGRSAVLYSDDTGTIIAQCDPDACDDRPFTDTAATAVAVGVADENVVAATRTATGRVNFHRCNAGCTEVATTELPGRHDQIALAAAGSTATLVTAGHHRRITVFRCLQTCSPVSALEAAAPVWRLDVDGGHGGEVIAVLGPDGPWVAACDHHHCSATTEPSTRQERDRSGYLSHQ